MEQGMFGRAWEMIRQAWEIGHGYWPLFWFGIKTTVLIALTGTIIGLGMGLVIGSIRAIRAEPRDPRLIRMVKRVVYGITSLYIEVFRGTPMIVQAVFLYYLFKPSFHWSPIHAGIFIVSVNTGAYMAEIIRAGIQSVDKGQTEAARSIGMTALQTMVYVVLPQAVKNSFPAIGNEFVVNIKDSSVLSAISVTDLYFQSMSVAGSIFKYQQTMLVTSVIYLCLTFTTTRVLGLIERRMGRQPASYPTSQTMPHPENMQGVR